MEVFMGESLHKGEWPKWAGYGLYAGRKKLVEQLIYLIPAMSKNYGAAPGRESFDGLKWAKSPSRQSLLTTTEVLKCYQEASSVRQNDGRRSNSVGRRGSP